MNDRKILAELRKLLPSRMHDTIEGLYDVGARNFLLAKACYDVMRSKAVAELGTDKGNQIENLLRNLLHLHFAPKSSARDQANAVAGLIKEN